jgi:hypothetical protein
MRIRRASLALAILALACSTTASCGGPPAPAGDAGIDGATDTGPTGCTPFGGMVFMHSTIGVAPGTSRHTYLDASSDAQSDVTITLTASMPGIVTLPATITVPAHHSRTMLRVTGMAAGTVMVHASSGGANPCTADIEVAVTAPTVPACAGSTTGMVTPGGVAVTVPTGTTLAGAGVSVAPGASRTDIYHVDPFMVSVGCHADLVPSGYVALGPAVTFDSSTVYRFRREIDLAVPIYLSLLPSDAHRGHVEMAYSGPGVAPRIVGIATPNFAGSAGGGILHFQAPRLGTYQAVVRSDVPHMVSRTFHERGIMGFSMGGSGSGRIGTGHPELFDFVAPLGGPTDWIYLLEYIHRYHIGGFCTEAQRAAGMPCSAASLDYAPDRNQLYEHTQEFEDWWYEDGYGGQGGHFNRQDYISIFRDLTAMFANANTDTSDSATFPDIVPPGIPDSTRSMTDAERCMMANLSPLTIHGEPAAGDTDPHTGFFDDEYNPQGHYDVIPFCDGAERRNFDPMTLGPCTASTTNCQTDTGAWDPAGTQTTPMEVALAVDINHNGVRDGGEPVIRNGHEPFTDTGCDGIVSSAETGYDAITNPDPAGDDYDFQYNPLGTEGNWERDDCGGGMAEHYDDFGLDGVNNTPQVPNGFDHGEGNGHYDMSAGADRMISTSPRGLVRGYRGNGDTVHMGYPLSTIDGFDFFADGGVRDLFNWAVQGHHTIGGFAARGIPVRYYNSHGALHLDGRSDDTFAFNQVNYEEIGRYTEVRYGSIDATEDDKILGDGGHVGTPNQLLHRFFSALGMMSSRWPDGDRAIVNDRICSAVGPGCEHINSTVQMFTAPTTGRTGQVTIVLPPGYFAPENASLSYPVVYFLHGYGMAPADLQALGNIMWNYMIQQTIPEARRVPKMIFVFPDGRCLPDECLRGTFYTDAPASTPHGAQMEQFLLDLDAYMHTTYRVRGEQTVMVSE